jgi:hypothetical protein
MAKIKAECKCGAKFESQALGGPLLNDYRVWVAIHNTRCYRVKSWDYNDKGDGIEVILRPPSEEGE